MMLMLLPTSKYFDLRPRSSVTKVRHCPSYLQDAQGAVTALANASGTIVERVMYDAYGKSSLFQEDWTTTQSSSVYANEILYAGYRLDPESGMYQVRHREYHPTLGRWVQRDPLGYHDGPSQAEQATTRKVHGVMGRHPTGSTGRPVLLQVGREHGKTPADR
jgi:RHS repeat-associated protein